MLPDGRRLGAHLPLGGGMVRAVDRAIEIGASAMQVFSDNPTAWKRRDAPPVELPAFRARLAAADLAPIAIHASYLVNLAGPDPDFFERSVGLLTAELHGASSFAAGFVNVHIGSHRGEGVRAGIDRVADGVAQTVAGVDALPPLVAEAPPLGAGSPESPPLVAESPPLGAESPPLVAPAMSAAPAMLVLENSAGGGWGVGVDLDELSGIADAIDRRGVAEHRVGFCLDAAHAWGAGIDLGSPDAIDAFLEQFDARIGLRRLVMVHLNDSKVELGSRLDRHEHLGAGRIGPVGLGHLLRHPSLRHATYLLETPGMDEGYDAVNLARARALAAGEPLAPLPPEAFELVGSSRARTAPA